MKIYWETSQPYLSRSMKRVAQAFKKYSPPEIEWVDHWTKADMLIEHYVGRDPELEARIQQKPYVLVFYCSSSSRTLPEEREYYERLIGGAKLVYTYLPLDEEGFSGNIMLGPCGIDIDVFQSPPANASRNITVLTTGYVAYSEGIDAMIAATQICGTLVHVGGGLEAEFGYDVGVLPHVQRFSDISDEQLVSLYGQSQYVSGLRRDEGFELPVLEGILCGARPICFDLPVYRRWFDGLAVFVPVLEPNELADILADLFLAPYWPVTPAEQELVRHQFSWENVSRQFWSRLNS